MTFIRLAALYVLCVAAQWWLGAHLSPGGVTANVLLDAAVAVAVLGGPVAAHGFAFMCGLYFDFMSPRMFGGHALAFTLMARAIWFVRWRLDFPTPPSQMALAAAASVFAAAFHSLLGIVFAGGFIWRGWAFSVFTPVANAVAAPFVFALAAVFAPPPDKSRRR
ncbi:MAG: hypothetical protein WC421_10320 [Elusimicrobiales bacterium]